MAEAIYKSHGDLVDYTPAVAVSAGEVIQLADGRAGVAPLAIAAAVTGAVRVRGRHVVAKTATMVILDGGRVYWDHSANKAHYKTVNDRDFFIGVAVGDAASADATMTVDLNVQQRVTIDALNGPSLQVASGTAAAGGFGLPQVYGGSRALTLTATSEVQKIDILSVDKVDVASNPILEAIFRIGTNGSGSASDFNIGLANGTHATDADSITEHVFIHTDGGALTLNAQSKDGTTTVAATTTTLSATAGSATTDRVEVWMDARDPSDVQVYVNGALVLGSTVFDLSHAVGPLGALAHYEKSTGTETGGPIYIDRLTVRTAQQ